MIIVREWGNRERREGRERQRSATTICVAKVVVEPFGVLKAETSEVLTCVARVLVRGNSQRRQMPLMQSPCLTIVSICSNRALTMVNDYITVERENVANESRAGMAR